MARKNQYAKRARISEAKIREIVRYVAADLTALQAAALSGLNRNTVNRLYRGVRERRLLACEAQRRLFGVVEVDERFFGARRVKGRRGRGAYGKTVVFGIFARQGHVYTEILLLMVVNKTRIMGTHRNSHLTNVLGVIVVLVISWLALLQNPGAGACRIGMGEERSVAAARYASSDIQARWFAPRERARWGGGDGPMVDGLSPIAPFEALDSLCVDGRGQSAHTRGASYSSASNRK